MTRAEMLDLGVVTGKLNEACARISALEAALADALEELGRNTVYKPEEKTYE